MSINTASFVVAALCLLVPPGFFLTSCGSSEHGKRAATSTGGGYPNGNPSNTRDASGSIDRASVGGLEVAWRLPLTSKSQYGSYSSTPIISDGTMYSQDLVSNVQAIDVRTGKVLWTRVYNSPDAGPNGLVVAGGHVFGTTSTAVFSLDEKTGRQVWAVALARNAHEGVDMAPGYHDGLVYASTVPGNTSEFYRGEGVGVLWALDASTGRKVWHFNTAPDDLWSPAHVGINSGGGLWYTPAFDNEGNMYIGTANPGPFPGTAQYPWGSSRPGPNLYTDSLVKLNASTGKLEWYYQLTPHDLYDWDLQDPPILVTVKGRQMVLGAGKAGIVLALDRKSGKLLWKRAVGIHNGHGKDSLYALKHEYSKLKSTETVYPGFLGGVIAPMATNGSTVFVPVVNLPVTLAKQAVQREGPSESGELVALDTATGAMRWRHKFSSAAFAAATVVNDLVFTTTFNGMLYALDTSTGQVALGIQLAAGSNTGVAVSGSTLIAPAGVVQTEGQAAEITAFRLK
jgi:outer membrane protein assembly factor BamB